jgi:hypothetical protein
MLCANSVQHKRKRDVMVVSDSEDSSPRQSVGLDFQELLESNRYISYIHFLNDGNMAKFCAPFVKQELQICSLCGLIYDSLTSYQPTSQNIQNAINSLFTFLISNKLVTVPRDAKTAEFFYQFMLSFALHTASKVRPFQVNFLEVSKDRFLILLRNELSDVNFYIELKYPREIANDLNASKELDSQEIAADKLYSHLKVTHSKYSRLVSVHIPNVLTTESVVTHVQCDDFEYLLQHAGICR